MSDDATADKDIPATPPSPAEDKVVDGPDGEKTETELSGSTGAQEKSPDPTRYGDWEKNGRCIDF